MILVHLSEDSATLAVEAGFSQGKTFYTTYRDGEFICVTVNPGMKGKPFYINDLDEDAILHKAIMAAHNSAYKDAKMLTGQGVFKNANESEKVPVVPNFNPKKFFKGTTFGGVTENVFGYIAALLKEGLGNVEVHIGVKLKWTSADLLKYINAIQERTSLSVQVIS